jgi:hypothetical protein
MAHKQSKNLGEESSRYWHVIQNKTYQFRRLQTIAEFVKEVTKDRMLRFYDRYIAASAPCRRKLCVQVVAKQHEEAIVLEEEKSGENGRTGNSRISIKDASEFKRTMPLFALPETVDIEVAPFDIQKECDRGA